MNRTLRICVFLIVSMSFVFSVAEPQKEVACPSCIHVEYKMRNLPWLVERIVGFMLSGMKLSNPKCVSNKVVPETCKKSLLPFLMENKCTTARIDLKAVGLQSIFPDAELDVSVVARSCKTVTSGTADKCVELSNLGAAEKEQLTKNLKNVEKQWNKVTYSGNVCTKAP